MASGIVLKKLSTGKILPLSYIKQLTGEPEKET
jgi:hypothetical protein